MIKRKSVEEEIDVKRLKLEPQAGLRPVVLMTLHVKSKQAIRVLLDSGSTVPVLSSARVAEWEIPTIERKIPRIMTAFDDSTIADSGKSYTPELTIQHDQHFSQVSFEISKLDDNCNAILPQ
ncbi:hypothetical protein OCU04_002763 [Sclerotinia nivalis]|uniref:Uncharacterized protein n=1 Tax=Sclerotinia nivalis TaxID=352851 RepID=A0A9X0DNX8_9HELO|nr:hypothetical protein OCU04_002763 [Sclerotinia nivalis]